MFDTRILSLGVLPYQNSIDVVVRSLVTLNRNTRSHVSEEGEGSSQCEVKRNVTLADFSSQPVNTGKTF